MQSSANNVAPHPDNNSNPAYQVPPSPLNPSFSQNPPLGSESPFAQGFLAATHPRIDNDTSYPNGLTSEINYYHPNIPYLPYTNPFFSSASYPVDAFGNLYPPPYFNPFRPTLLEQLNTSHAYTSAYLPPPQIGHLLNAPSSPQSDSSSSSEEEENGGKPRSNQAHAKLAAQDYANYVKTCEKSQQMSRADFTKTYNAAHDTSNLTLSGLERFRTKSTLKEALQGKKAELKHRPIQNHEEINELNAAIAEIDALIAEIDTNSYAKRDAGIRIRTIQILERFTPPENDIVDLQTAISYGLSLKKILPTYKITDLRRFLKIYNIQVSDQAWTNANQKEAAKTKQAPETKSAPESQPVARPPKKRKYPEFSQE